MVRLDLLSLAPNGMLIKLEGTILLWTIICLAIAVHLHGLLASSDLSEFLAFTYLSSRSIFHSKLDLFHSPSLYAVPVSLLY